MEPANIASAVKMYQEMWKLLLEPNQWLLNYLLDPLAVVASEDDANRMDNARLVATFQPSLLSRKPNDMSAENHQNSARVTVFLIENLDHFTFGLRNPPLQPPYEAAGTSPDGESPNKEIATP
jgi:hypothetical protein